MMTARDILTPRTALAAGTPAPTVEASTPVFNLLHRLVESPSGRLDVIDSKDIIGSIDYQSLLQGLSSMIIPRNDCSLIEISCPRTDYSASRIAHAVEDADAHLTDLLITSSPDAETLRAMIRVQCLDPSAAVRNLERYGYDVVGVDSRSYADSDEFSRRLLELKTYLNV